MNMTLDEALQKGIEAHKAGKFQEADRYYTAMLKAQPRHPDANHNMGVLAVGVGKVEQALPFFKTALQVNQNIEQFWLSYIDALIKLERHEEAHSVFKQAKEKGLKSDAFVQLEASLFPSNGEESKKPFSENPPSDKFRTLIGLYNHGKLEEVLSGTTTILAEFPNSVIYLNLQGAANAGLRRFEAAIESYKKALKIKPDTAEFYNNIGNALKEQDKLGEAIEVYKEALKIKPGFAEAYNNLGNALIEMGKLGEAIEAYKEALKIKPDFAEAYNNMGNALKEQDKLGEAIEAYKEALKIKPDTAEFYNNMGNALKERDKLGEAIEAYKEALKIKPDFAEAYHNMGVALKKNGDLDAAIEAYKEALKIKPGIAESHNNLGNTLIEMGKLGEAIEALNKALDIKPDYAEAYNNMGNALKGNGKLEQAVEAYKRALSLKPGYANATHMVSSLTGKKTNSAPREYVENLFDVYARKFDGSLVEQLEYTIPKTLSQIVVKQISEVSLGSVLDLGCGTGLTGLEFRDISANLEGIDLSKSMLEHARLKNVYDKLTHCDITEYLSKAELDFDYFISTDVFIYVGELSEIFRLIKSRNRAPGKLAFSTEHTEKHGFHLEKSGRYSHSKSYIEGLCKKFSYSLSHFTKVDLRKEKGKFLEGGIYILDF